MEIRTKAEFFRLWKAGVLGNRTNLWDDPLEAFSSPSDTIGFREIGKAGGGKWQRVARGLTLVTAMEWIAEDRKFIMDDGVPDDRQTLIGEICRTYHGLQGILGVTQLPMRLAMKDGLLIPRTGATVLALLGQYMDSSSRDDLDQLMELYPDATIEFACYEVPVGIFPNRNTMFWEVRNY